MVDFEYLYKGLCALAHAHQAGVLAGHLGAAVVAGYFFGEDHGDLDNAVHTAIEQELGPIEAAEHDPLTPDYWKTGTLKRDSARLTHRIKTLYGFFSLMRHIKNAEKRKQAEQSLRYLMA